MSHINLITMEPNTIKEEDKYGINYLSEEELMKYLIELSNNKK